MQSGSKRELRKKGSEIKPTVYIEKDGITDGLIGEVRLQIKNHKHVEIRILPSVERPKDDIAKELEARTSSRLVEIRGNTVLPCEDSLFEVGRRFH
ncbi:MAG: YhbY family RNA-binding protein [Methanomassiliicoccales archaeon]|jgi:RNA-binding protein